MYIKITKSKIQNPFKWKYIFKKIIVIIVLIFIDEMNINLYVHFYVIATAFYDPFLLDFFQSTFLAVDNCQNSYERCFCSSQNVIWLSFLCLAIVAVKSHTIHLKFGSYDCVQPWINSIAFDINIHNFWWITYRTSIKFWDALRSVCNISFNSILYPHYIFWILEDKFLKNSCIFYKEDHLIMHSQKILKIILTKLYIYPISNQKK